MYEESARDRLAVRLSLIISRLLQGESLSVEQLACEFNVSERTLRRDFNQRLVYLDLECENGIYRLAKGRNGIRSDRDIISFARLTHVAQVFPSLDSRLLSLLLNGLHDSPFIVYHKPPSSLPALFGGFYRLTQAIVDQRRVSLRVGNEHHPELAPYRLIYFDGYWYLVGENQQQLQVFLLMDITDVTLSTKTFQRQESLNELTTGPGFIHALPHFRLIRDVLATFNGTPTPEPAV